MTIDRRTKPYTEVPPNRAQPVQFPERADYMAGYMPGFGDDLNVMADEFNATAENVNNLEQSAKNSKDLAEAAALVANSASNIKGAFVPGQTSALQNETWVYEGAFWFALADTSATPQESSGDWASLSKHNKLTNRDESGAHPASAISGINEMRNELVGGNVYPLEPENELQLGDAVPLGVTHLRVKIDDRNAIVLMSPLSSGSVSSLTASGAVIGGVPVTFTNPLLSNFKSAYDMVAAKTFVGNRYFSGQGLWQKTSNSSSSILDFAPLGRVYAVDYLPDGYVTDGSVDYRAELNIAAQVAADSKLMLIMPDFPLLVGFDENTYGLVVPSGSAIYFPPGSSLNAETNNLSNYEILSIRDKCNIHIYYPVINGDKYTHTGTSGEWGMGISIRGNCYNVHVYDANISECWGDGVYIGQTSTGSTPSDIYFHGITRIKRCRRQGVSIISVNGLTFDRLQVKDTKSSDSTTPLPAGPHAGVDIEPNDENSQIKGVVIHALSGGGNDAGLFYVFLGGISQLIPDDAYHVDVSVGSIHDDGSAFAAQIAGLNPNVRYSGQIHITSVTSNKPKLNGVSVRNWAAQASLPINIERAQISDWLSDSTKPARNRTAVTVYQTGDPNFPAIGNVRIGSLDLSSTLPESDLYQAAIFAENSSGAGLIGLDITVSRVSGNRRLFAELPAGAGAIKKNTSFGSGLSFLRTDSASIIPSIDADLDVVPAGGSPTLTLPDSFDPIYQGRVYRLQYTQGGSATFVRLRSSVLPLYVNGVQGANFLFNEDSGVVHIEFARGVYLATCQGFYTKES